MNFLLFYSWVWKMRKHQQAYFKDRRRSDLIEAKRFEKLVDDELDKRLVIVHGEPSRFNHQVEEQVDLFTTEEQ